MPEPETLGDDRAERSPWSAPWVVAGVAVVVAIAATSLALHYRSAAHHPGTPRAQHQAVPVSFPPPAPLHMGAKVYRVRAGNLAMRVTFTSAVDESQRRSHGQLQVTALVTGAPAGSRLRLDGGDCSTNGSLTWASGVADAAGTAYLTGRIRTLSASHAYYLELEPWRIGRRLPGLNGIWLGGLIERFHAGSSPCL